MLNGAAIDALELPGLLEEPSNETNDHVGEDPGDSTGTGSDNPTDVPPDSAPGDLGPHYHLEVISGPATGATALVTVDKLVVIGASSSSDLRVSGDDLVSRRHATFQVKDGRLTVIDAGSRNGTYMRIDGERELTDGEHVLVGSTLIKVTHEG